MKHSKPGKLSPGDVTETDEDELQFVCFQNDIAVSRYRGELQNAFRMLFARFSNAFRAYTAFRRSRSTALSVSSAQKSAKKPLSSAGLQLDTILRQGCMGHAVQSA